MWNKADIRQPKLKFRRFAWGVLLLTLVGAFLRFPGLFGNTFHADEALFGMWARYIAVWRDPLLFDVPTPVDKPPLLFYLQALFYPLQGPVEWAARLPNFFVSILLIPLVGRMAFALTNRSAERAWLAAAVVAFSPLAIQFSATAFTDPLLTFLVTMAVWHAVRPGESRAVLNSAGFWLGLALLTKYQAVLFLPFLLLKPKDLRRSLLAFGTLFTVLLLWDWVPNGQIDLFGRQVAAYGGIGLIQPDEFVNRLSQWIWLFLFVPGWGASAAILAWLIGAMLWRSESRFEPITPITLILGGFIAGYLILHVVVQTLLEPRYLLPLVPLAALAVARLPLRPDWFIKPVWSFALPIVVATLLLAQAIPARVGHYPFGGRPTNDDGAAVIAQTIIDEPYGTVLYDHWYSWHWRYHFFYRGVYVEWFGTADDLLENLEAFYDENSAEKRYLALKIDDPLGDETKTALLAEGYRLEEVSQEGKIVLYLIGDER